jgi:dTDP-glucose 4,6-dehydratase
MVLVTGGAGFIGSNFVLKWVAEEKQRIINLDKLTYAGNLNNLASIANNSDHIFVQGDIGDRRLVRELLHEYKPQKIVHFAAETHVDRSIHHPDFFLNTNVVGGFVFLEEVLSYWKGMPSNLQTDFRFLNVSTDEVYGSLSQADLPSTEESRFAPNSPYSASKASFDHFARAFHKTYGLPICSTYCCNNFGPFQFPEKLIPLVITNALQGKPLPIYGDGQQMRQWIYVEDHCSAIKLVLEKGIPGSNYNIGDGMEYNNLSLVKAICRLLGELKPDSSYCPYESLIKHVKDRPAHDVRYSINSTKLKQEFGWKPKESFEYNLRKTVLWYLNHLPWLESVVKGEYRDWVLTQYEGR